MDLNVASGMRNDPFDLKMSADKVRSLCLSVELCVVCGDRASGNLMALNLYFGVDLSLDGEGTHMPQGMAHTLEIGDFR